MAEPLKGGCAPRSWLEPGLVHESVWVRWVVIAEGEKGLAKERGCRGGCGPCWLVSAITGGPGIPATLLVFVPLP